MLVKTNKKKGQSAMEKTDYGNWVPATMMRTLAIVLAVLLILAWMGISIVQNIIFSVMVILLLVIVLIFTLYMWKCQNEFAFEKGGLMGKIHEYLLEHLDWNGKGLLLDIGCGAGALTIRCAKRFPNAKLVGVDFWGSQWNYGKGQCERNAQIEGVANRMIFQKGDAAKLPFRDKQFEAVVSNFVFHEVQSEKDKRKVVKEALRVLKKGGAFAFQDMFSQKNLYGDMDEFVEELKKEGISEIYYIASVEKQGWIPSYLQTPWMLSGVALLYGKK